MPILRPHVRHGSEFAFEHDQVILSHWSLSGLNLWPAEGSSPETIVLAHQHQLSLDWVVPVTQHMLAKADVTSYLQMGPENTTNPRLLLSAIVIGMALSVSSQDNVERKKKKIT